MTGIKPSYWELSSMRELAAAYVVQYRKSGKAEAPPPYVDLEACRKTVDKKVRSFFG